MTCPLCGADNPEGGKACLQCGGRFALTCPQCLTELPPQARFCFACGARIDALPSEGPAEDPNQRLQRLVPKEFAERLLATRGQVARERRTVTILFSDVTGSTAMAETLDPEDVMEIMDGAFDVLIEPVYRFEGTVARLMGDAILAFFGAPIAHDDDPERAIRAALEIRTGAQLYAARLERERGISGFDVRVGIHTGLVVVGEVGSDLRVEYTAMGDAVNLAARMEQNAPPGGILITRDTYRQVRGVFDVLAQEPLAVKGRTEPVQTYLVQRAKPRAFRKGARGVEGIETRMVGREVELKHLQTRFLSVINERTLQVVTISGEAGVGKSRLMHEFDLWAELLPQPFFYFKARAFSEMRNQPYGLLRNLVAFRFQIQESDPAGRIREKLEAGVVEALGTGDGSQQAAHLIGYLAGYVVGDSPHLAALRDDPQRLRDQALACLKDYFGGLAARSPVLILLEDLHWADHSSLDALDHLALQLCDQPLMIGSAARPEIFERRPGWGEGQPFHHQLELETLSRSQSQSLVAEILQRVERVPNTLRDLIAAGAEGNPFFIEELIKMLLDDGVILKGLEQWQVDPSRLAEIRVPPTLAGVLQARLDRLPLEERTVLQQASVVGRLFWDLAVARIHASAAEGAQETSFDETGIEAMLSALWAREMVFQRETSAFAKAREYVFKHALLREATYDSLLRRLRRVYHGLVADWLLGQVGDRAGQHAALIADHLELAGRGGEAVQYLLQAGDRARGLYAHREAIRAYERALVLLKELADDEQAARTQMKLGLAHDTAFDFRRARQAYDEGFVLWQRASEAEPATLPPPPHALRGTWHKPVTLDPGLSWDVGSYQVISHLFSGLVARTPDLGIVPDVAARWETFDDGARYVFHLRDDVHWSDGMPVTAHDFEYAWKRILDPATGSGAAYNFLDIRGAQAYHEGSRPDAGAVGIRALDDRTLVLELESPRGDLLHRLAGGFPVPRHVVVRWGEAWTDPKRIVSNGPFTLKSWREDDRLVLARNPLYHGRYGGNLERVEMSVAPAGEWRVALERYEADRADLFALEPSTPREMDRVRQRHGAEYVSLPSGFTSFLHFDATRPPFDDRRVRRALALALDRQALADGVVGSYYSPATGGFVPPGMPGHCPGIALPYEPQQARELLASAGYPGGSGFPSVELMAGLRWRGVCEHLRSTWQKHLGLEIRWRVVAYSELFVAFQSETPPPLSVRGWGGDCPDPDYHLGADVMCGAGWRSERYLDLVARARRSTDQPERMVLYARAERILAEEAPEVPLFYSREHWLFKPWVKRYPLSVGGSPFWRDVILEPH